MKTLSDWIVELHSEDKKVRQEAIRALSYNGEASIPILIEALREDNIPPVLFAEIFHQIGQTALDALTDELQRPNLDVQKRIADILALIGDSRAVLPLVMLMDTKVTELRAKIAESLSYFADPRATSPLIEALSDDHPVVRANAAAALGNYHRDPRVMGALLTVADDPNPNVRAGAARGMAMLVHEQVILKLNHLAHDEDTNVRQTAAAALQHQAGDRMVFQRLKSDVSDEVKQIIDNVFTDDVISDSEIDVMRHSNPRVRADILAAVGERGNNAQAAKVIILALNDINPAVRKTAVETLAKIGKDTVPDLIKALDTRSKYTRTGLIEALGLIGDEMALDSIINYVQDSEPMVREAVIKSLKSFGKNDKVIKALRLAAKDHNREIREYAQEILAGLGQNDDNPFSRFFRRFGND